MIRYSRWVSVALLAVAIPCAQAQPSDVPIVQRNWYETRTTHFNIYSCGATQNVFKLGAQLEQFCEAYASLAGADAVATPPIVVVAFPDHHSMEPFLQLYNGRPSNVAGFFQRSSDENLIVLSLPEAASGYQSMAVIFHEYAHFLFRRNGQIWPLWLKEGIAEVYSSFDVSGYRFRIGGPIDHHLQLLEHTSLTPLGELFTVTHESPQYNEKTLQGPFYAESWLLTQFLMAGDNTGYKARFGQFTALLRAGEFPEQAFTNALHAPLPAVEAELSRYRQRGQFTPIELILPANVSSPKMMSTRPLTPVEVYFRLGDELLQIRRANEAEEYFTRAEKLAPASPLPYEGLGLLAMQRKDHQAALRYLKQSLERNSASHLSHYAYAWERLVATADSQNRYSRIDGGTAADIRAEFHKSLALMPYFAPAHNGLGFFEMVQGDDLRAAEQHLERAVQLEPDNLSYLFGLAEEQMANHDAPAARRTLALLLLPSINEKLRAQAEELSKQLNRKYPQQ